MVSTLRRPGRLLLAACLSSGVLVTSLSMGDGSKANQLQPQVTDANANDSGQCVEPTDVMRRYHMDFLLHQRDKTVYKGIRTKRHSLQGCVDCHVNRDDQGRFIPINAPGH